MTFSSSPSYPIAELKALLSERTEIDLTPVELAEILWLALHIGERITDEPPPELQGSPPEGRTQKQQLPPNRAVEEPDPSAAAVVTEPPKPVKSQEEATAQVGGTALPVRIPEAIALRNRREIARSLRPLMRKVPSKLRRAMDEEATAIESAETRTWSPVVKPEPERWLELAIVIEVTNLLDVWRDTIAEFQHLLERHGAFRDVRTWQLKPNAAGDPQLFLQTTSGLKRNARNPKELSDAGGRRLVLLLSDCTSKAWRSGKIPELLELWSRENPVTIGQLLPESYWDRSALGLSYSVALRARRAGALSRDWVVEGLSPWRRQRLPRGLKFPVVTVQPQSLGRWAKAIAVLSEQQTTGVVLDVQAFQSNDAVADSPQPLTAEQLVRRFRGTASQKAQELADMMAVLPVNWSVIRLIQKNLIQKAADVWQGTGALYLAEIFLSGLLRPLPMETEQNGKPSPTQQYDFVEGVRDLLLSAIPISEAEGVGEEIAEAVFRQLPQEVQDRVNADIERRREESLSYFKAFLIPDLPWGENAGAEILRFARVTGQVLRKWGGDYAALAEQLERTPKKQKIPPKERWPKGWLRPKTLTFEVATIAIETEVNLQPFEFETATVTLPARQIIQEFSNPLNAFQRVDEAVYSFASRHLSELEQDIYIRSWDYMTYDQMGIDLDYHPHYLSTKAGTLWNLLSQVTGEKVTKTTLRQAVIRWATSEAPEISIHRQQRGGQQFIEDLGNGVTLEMLQIPGGTFVMGAPEYEAGSLDDERPQHHVTVPSFYMSKYPVTQAQWRAISVRQGKQELEPNPSFFVGDNKPVEKVSWNDAVEFCDRLSQYTGRDYRLPTEAEWEYACRAGTTTPFHFGETITTDLANYRGTWAYEGETYPAGSYGRGRGIYREETTDVGSFGVANAFGLCDMHGNVREWCQDPWHENYEGAPINGSTWKTGGNEASRVIRGGGWYSIPRNCRSASRFRYVPGGRTDSIGFRVVCAAPGTS